MWPTLSHQVIHPDTRITRRCWMQSRSVTPHSRGERNAHRQLCERAALLQVQGDVSLSSAKFDTRSVAKQDRRRRMFHPSHWVHQPRSLFTAAALRAMSNFPVSAGGLEPEAPSHAHDVTFFSSGAAFGASTVAASLAPQGQSGKTSWTSRHQKHKQRVTNRVKELTDGSSDDGGFGPTLQGETPAGRRAREAAYRSAWATIQDGGERVLHSLNMEAFDAVTSFISKQGPCSGVCKHGTPAAATSAGAAAPSASDLLPVVLLFAGEW